MQHEAIIKRLGQLCDESKAIEDPQQMGKFIQRRLQPYIFSVDILKNVFLQRTNLLKDFFEGSEFANFLKSMSDGLLRAREKLDLNKIASADIKEFNLQIWHSEIKDGIVMPIFQDGFEMKVSDFFAPQWRRPLQKCKELTDGLFYADKIGALKAGSNVLNDTLDAFQQLEQRIEELWFGKRVEEFELVDFFAISPVFISTNTDLREAKRAAISVCMELLFLIQEQNASDNEKMELNKSSIAVIQPSPKRWITRHPLTGEIRLKGKSFAHPRAGDIADRFASTILPENSHNERIDLTADQLKAIKQGDDKSISKVITDMGFTGALRARCFPAVSEKKVTFVNPIMDDSGTIPTHKTRKGAVSRSR